MQTLNEDGKRTNLTNYNYIGVADKNYANGEVATVQLSGSVDDAQSDLVPATIYYVKANGSLSVIPDANVDSGNAVAGLALTSNKMLIRYT